MKILLTFFISTALTFLIHAQTSQDYAVMIQATVSESPASIILKFNKIPTTKQFKIYRKTKMSNTWGTAIAILPSSATQFTDNAVTVGNAYEYNITRYDSASLAYGYIYVGIKLPETTYRGRLLLMVDGNYVSSLATEIAQLQNDLIADGWQVKLFHIYASDVQTIKSLINIEIKTEPTTNALYLLGKIPVPYSGGFDTLNLPDHFYPPDGHPSHGGAWPADLYYGCFNESFWTDFKVKDSTEAKAANNNIPGDGKFDPMYIYDGDTVKLQIGRVDLSNMPTFGMNDTLLIKQYLNKAHAYKVGQIATVRRGLIDDNFGVMGGEAFASTGWKNFSTMFGDSVFNRDYISSIKQVNYLFSYGCGWGSDTTCIGIGATSSFTNDSINTIFTMLFGSYFGDWNTTNNFLRAPLCSRPSALASVWSGRPYWQFHHMSLGETIGYSTRLTQNNYYDTTVGVIGYAYNAYPTFTHVALMGDPSLRLHTMKPVQSVKAFTSSDSLSVHVFWKPSSDSTEGYLILTSRTLNGKFILAGKALSTDTTFVHSTPSYGINYYMVRPLKLEITPSGTYYNLSLGVIDSAYSKRTVGVNELSKVQLNASIFPNPNNGIFKIDIENTKTKNTIECYDFTGRLILNKEINSHEIIDLTSFSKGLYFIKIKNLISETVKKVVVE